MRTGTGLAAPPLDDVRKLGSSVWISMTIYLIKYQRQQNREAIQLKLTRADSDSVVSFIAPFFRVTGSTVWTVHGDGYVARLTESGWEGDGSTWTGMTFEGPCRLVMGVPCEPTAVSQILEAVSISHDVLSANGAAFATYHHRAEMWRAVSTDKWWHAFRIETIHEHAQLAEVAADSPARAGLAAQPTS